MAEDRASVRIAGAGLLRSAVLAGLCVSVLVLPSAQRSARAQTPPPPPVVASPDVALAAPDAPVLLTDAEMQVLVARIALYPDDLVALITAASLYPIQIVEAERFLEQRQKDPNRQPKSTWDGSIIALLNYPEIVKMMSDDLDWTQSLGAAITNQQKDVLVAIQELRARAVASGVIKSDDKVTVTTENNTVVIQPANPDRVYIPQYAPQMFYEPGYAMAPVGYYADPYPSYLWPTATFFTAAVTGAVWAATVDWNNWGVWGGPWRGNVDVDCNNCFNNRNFTGRVNLNDIDWKNVDRSRLHFDHNQFDRTNIRNSIERNKGNDLRARAAEIHRPALAGAGGGPVKDVRKSTLEGLKREAGKHPGLGDRAGGGLPAGLGDHGPGAKGAHLGDRPNAGAIKRPDGGGRPQKINRPDGAPKLGGRVDSRPGKPSGLGEVRSGKAAKIHSDRGGKALGGGMGGNRPAIHAGGGGGGRPAVRAGGGGGGHPAIHRGGGGRPGGGGGHGGGKRPMGGRH